MALLLVNNIKINTSLHEFVDGSVPPFQMEAAISKVGQYEQTGNSSLIPEFMGLIDEGDALFPLTFAVKFCRGNTKKTLTFRENYTVFERDAEHLINYYGADITDPTRSNIKRILLMLWTTTTVRSLADLSEEVWLTWVSSMKEENTQFKQQLGFNGQDIRALRCLASYMDAHYPSETGYLTPVKVRRTSNTSIQTGKTIDFVDNPPAEFSGWAEIFENYKLVVRFRSAKMPNTAYRMFGSWLEQYPVEVFRDPKHFLSTSRFSPSFIEYVEALEGEAIGDAKRSEVSFLINMVDHFIEENMIVIEDDERTILGQPIVTSTERKKFTRARSSSSRSEASSNPMPLRWVREVQDILTENDWAWPKSQGSQWVKLNLDGEPRDVWNPVCAYLIYSMTELPWRKIQFKSLDSGEGDSEKYDFAGDCWTPNSGPIAGYWDRSPSAHRKMRGVLNRQGEGFCFYVNTNKTGDRKHGHGELSGYYVPWKYSPMIRLFSELRDWQEKYNPLSSPTKYADVSSAFYGADAPSKNVEDSIPDRCYLFRDIQGGDGKLAPPTDNRLYTLWRLLMDELEKRLREKGEDVTIILSRNKSGGAMVARFPMHGLRVSGLTAFAEAGVPIEILSKLVAGHASILMTIYYLKYTAAHVTDVLSDARQKVEAIAAKDFGRHLRNRSIEDAMRVAVANEDYTLEGISTGQISTDQFFDTGLGVCPHNGTRCGDGLALNKTRFAPVPGGTKNCLRCRHFITGEPWLIPLVLNQQKLAGKVTDCAKKLEHFEIELEQAEDRRASIINEGGVHDVPPALIRKIRQLEQEVDRHGLDLNELLSTMNRAHLIIEQVKALQKCPQKDGVPALLADAHARIGEYREGTRFELIDSVLQASRIYPVLQDDGYEMERRSYIDTIMFNNGMKPLTVLNLTEDQKRKAADAAGKWLMTKVGAQETQLLISGAQTLQELGFEANEFSAKIEASRTELLYIEAAQ